MADGKGSLVRPVIIYVISALVVGVAVAWAVILPSPEQFSAGPYPMHRTLSRIPVRVVIALGGLAVAAIVARFAHPRERIPWPLAHEAGSH
jgi:hypothetical protein